MHAAGVRLNPELDACLCTCWVVSAMAAPSATCWLGQSCWLEGFRAGVQGVGVAGARLVDAAEKLVCPRCCKLASQLLQQIPAQPQCRVDLRAVTAAIKHAGPSANARAWLGSEKLLGAGQYHA